MIDLNWYSTLNQPLLTPPTFVFPIAWAVLYTLIFISLILFTVKQTHKSKNLGYVLFFTQMLLNISWTHVFFTFHKINIALTILILLDILVLFNIKEFYEISKKSAYFLIPYFFWILFATYLNAGILALN